MLGLVKKGFAHAAFALVGWSFKGEVPKASKTVFIAAPHTSNWDFILLVLCAWHFQLRLQRLGKHTIFQKPFLDQIGYVFVFFLQLYLKVLSKYQVGIPS